MAISTPLQAMSDLQLERFAAADNGAAFSILVERYVAPVNHYVRRMVGDPHVAEDLVQDAFMFAWRNRKTATNKQLKQFKGRMFDIARQRTANYFRDRSPATRFPAVGEDDDEMWQPAEERVYADPQQSAEQHETIALVRRVMGVLSADDRELISLRWEQGFSPKDIASLLGIKRNAVDQRLHQTNLRFARAYSAIAMFERGRKKCEELDHLLRNAIAGSVEATTIIDAHARKCAVCKEERRRLQRPVEVFGALALAPISIVLRQHLAEAAWHGAAFGGEVAMPAGSAAGGGTAAANESAVVGGTTSSGGLLGALVGVAGPLAGNGLMQLVIASLVVAGVAIWVSGVEVPLAPEPPFSGQERSARLPCSPVQPASFGPGRADDAYADAIVAATDRYRADRGLAPLVRDATLDAAAAEYAAFVVDTRWWTQPQAAGSGIHIGADCRDHFDRAVALGYPRRVVGENVMWSTADIVPGDQFAALLAGAFEDPANPEFGRVGVACHAREGLPGERSCVQVLAGDR